MSPSRYILIRLDGLREGHRGLLPPHRPFRVIAVFGTRLSAERVPSPGQSYELILMLSAFCRRHATT
jgi:hypothetical protein